MMQPRLYKKLRNKISLYKNSTYLNTAAFGPMENSTYLKQLWHLWKQGKEAVATTTKAARLVDESELIVKSKIGTLMDCHSKDIVFNQNITSSIYYALDNIADIEKAEIIIPEFEFSSMLIALKYYQEKFHFKIKVVPLDTNKDLFLDNFKKAITEKTSLVMMSHVNYLYGKILPIEEIIQYASNYSVPVFIDGAQSLGMIDVSLSKLKPAYYAGMFVKWLQGPPGHGFLFVDEKQQEKILMHKPGRRACINHLSIMDLSDQINYHDRSWKSESSTYNYNNLFLLSQCMDLQNQFDVKQRLEYVLRLRTDLIHLLNSKNNLIIHNDCSWDYAGILTIGSDTLDLLSIYNKLLEQKVITKYISKGNLLRISLSFLNNSHDIERLCSLIE